MTANNNSTKNTLIIIITIIFIVLSCLILAFQLKEVERDQNNATDEILTKISFELNKGILKDSTIASLKANLFYAIWVKTDKTKWIPVIYDKENFVHNSENPKDINTNIIYNVRLYQKTINKYQYTVWINKFDISFYIQNILIVFLFLLLVYLVLLLIVTIFFNVSSKNNQDKQSFEKYENENNTNYSYENEDDTVLNDFNEDENISENISDRSKIISDYKELWIKHFKISDDFKKNFSFEKIYNLIKFGVKPENYIYESLLFATEYFKWQNPKIFILQGNVFIESLTKEILTNNDVEIPLKGDKKGEIFIPLFPYNSHDIFGYFYFVWENDNNFYISDILYFLKFLFSEEAKSIFLDYKRQENILDDLKSKLDKKNNEVFFALFSVDGKEKFIKQFKYFQRSKIENDIFTKIQNDFSGFYIFKARPLCFGITGEKNDKEKIISFINQWISDKNKHNYPVSNDYGNIALSFSCGISFKNNRNIKSETLVNEAENYLRMAKEQGGNQVVSD